ncbi:MAG: RsmE family RNA methyltransferase [Candidatus Omnitrophota bacterium]
MDRFFIPHTDFQSGSLLLNDKKEIHHLKDVLRLKKGSPIRLFNGKGAEAQGTILRVESHQVEVKIDHLLAAPKPQVPHIILACAIPKKAKFETIIEKTTELDVAEIIPVQTKRTEVILNQDQANKKMARYQAVAINAAKQSRRNTIPVIHPIIPFTALIPSLDPRAISLIPCLSEQGEGLEKTLRPLKNEPKTIVFIIGPEGDFTPDEVGLAKKSGCIPISLGETVLKVDTAAISVVAFTKLYLHQQTG